MDGDPSLSMGRGGQLALSGGSLFELQKKRLMLLKRLSRAQDRTPLSGPRRLRIESAGRLELPGSQAGLV
jgi:hypothetical protein